MDVGSWLRNLGLGQYDPTFIENAIGSDVLPDLTEDDLEKLGIPLGDRKRILKAIKTMLAGTPDTPVTGGSRGNEIDEQSLAAAERRRLTVLICDLVGSTALSARLDPEDLCAVLVAFQAACTGIVRGYEGFLCDFRGDGMLAYFGFPRAHEDDAERSVRAALAIISSVGKLDTPAGEPLEVRIGIASGLVVVGDIKGMSVLQQQAIVGETPNLAARLQALALPGEVVIAESTRRLLRSPFRLRDLGAHQVKGLTDPVAAWAVEDESDSGGQFEAIHAHGLTNLIGRSHDIDRLLDCQRLAWRGEGQAALISGEPGIGKSCLAASLSKRIADQPHSHLLYQCSPYHCNSALRPFITHLERAAGLKAHDTSKQRLDKLDVLLADDPKMQAAAPLFAELLAIPSLDRYPQMELSSAEKRRKTLAALLDQLECLSRQKPVLLLFEDIHWADATSLELFNLLVERIRKLPVFVLFTFRPEFVPSWTNRSNVVSLSLGRLAQEDIKKVVHGVTGGRALPDEVIKQIIAKTDGNPLFVEELTKAVLETGILVGSEDGYQLDGPLPPLAIPATLHDSLMARLDRLGSGKEIGHIGAVIGREFSYSLIRVIAGKNETALRGALTELERAELVYRRGHPPDAVYSFKHALVRDAAYESLLKSRRHQLHGQIACALEEQFPEIIGSQPETVAHHFTEAGLLDHAINYWLKAGNLALSRSANAEAVKHLRQGIALLESRAPSPERARKELDFYLALGPAVAATQGHATPATLDVFARTRSLLAHGGTLSEQMTILWGVHLAYAMGGQYVAAHETAQECLALAAKHEHPGILALAHRFMGQTLFFMGGFVEARFHLERSLHLCAINQNAITSYRKFGADDQVTALSALARTLWILGFPEQAAAASKRSLERARSLGLPFTTAFALDGDALLGMLGGDPQRAATHADEGHSLSIEHGLADYEQRACFIQGALLAQRGDFQRGLELMHSAIAAIEHTKSLNRRTLYLSQYAAAHARLGKPDVALNLLEEAVQTSEQTGEKFFEAELYRLRGKVLLKLGRMDEAEAALQRALTVAREKQARWWELRSATALATHWHENGKHTDAYALLQPVYSWFGEGSETLDLQAAKTLLDELMGLPAPDAQSVPDEASASH